MKNKKILLTIGILLFVVGMFILFKAAIYGIYRSCISDIDNLDSVMEGYRNFEDIAVVNESYNDYLEYDDYKIGNFFKNFHFDKDASVNKINVYYQYDKNNDRIGMFSTSTFVQLVDASFNDDLVFFNSIEGENEISFSELFYSGFNNYIKDNKIDDDADLIRAWSKYDFNREYGVFTSLRTLREDYSIRLVASSTLIDIDKIYYLNGDLKGYVLEKEYDDKMLYEINAFKNNKRYIFSILSNDYSIEDVKEIIKTIVID